MLNQIRVNITPVEAESVEKGLDSRKWTETWASPGPGEAQKLGERTSVAGGISSFKASFAGQRLSQMTIAQRSLVIQTCART